MEEWENYKILYIFSTPFRVKHRSKVITKVVRPLVKHWRRRGIRIVAYLDDGWSHDKTQKGCKQNSDRIKGDLEAAGFVVNKEKSIWEPTQCIEWLGLIWDTKTGTLSIPDRRIESALFSIENVQKHAKTTARKLAQITGKIISMSPVLGNVTRIMTRESYAIIEQRSGWDTWITIKSCVGINRELEFWGEALKSLNSKSLEINCEPEIIAYSDASAKAGASFTMCYGKQIAHRMWEQNEQVKSSTWRELEALLFGLKSFVPIARGKSLKWYTDCKNVERITKIGSRKSELQEKALNIFTTCVKNAIRLEVQWLPRNENEEADLLSRIIDFEDWG